MEDNSHATKARFHDVTGLRNGAYLSSHFRFGYRFYRGDDAVETRRSRVKSRYLNWYQRRFHSNLRPGKDKVSNAFDTDMLEE